MKKIFRILGLGLLVIPCMLVMTACSGKPVVNIKGNYVAVTETEQIAETKSYLTAQGDQDFGSMTGSRMKIKANGKIKNQKFDMTLDAYCTLNDNVLNMSMDYDILGTYMKIYVDNEFMYIDYLGEKIKTETPNDINDIINSSNNVNGVMISPSLLLDSLQKLEEDALVTNALNYSKSVNGETTKIKITLHPDIMAMEAYTKYEVYFVFENDVFEGMRVEYNAIMDNDNMNIVAEFAKYDGTIKRPSAKELAKYTLQSIGM